MTTFRCAACGHRSTPRDPTVVRLSHACPNRRGEQVPMVPLDATRFEVYCGNFTCPSRLDGVRHWVDQGDIPDGAVWLCPECRT